ncbi:TPA: hypothetical protein P0E06_004272 [Vibrio fluvialis clinical-1]|nr:hypothetical protein [Vibrio fluvialis]HDM8036839.1 hypothetical protein [Vibrio fluvialis clinical-1]
MENYLKVQLSESRLPAIRNLFNELLEIEGLQDIFMQDLRLEGDSLGMTFVHKSGENVTPSEQQEIQSKLYNLGIIYMIRD